MLGAIAGDIIGSVYEAEHRPPGVNEADRQPIAIALIIISRYY